MSQNVNDLVPCGLSYHLASRSTMQTVALEKNGKIYRSYGCPECISKIHKIIDGPYPFRGEVI